MTSEPQNVEIFSVLYRIRRRNERTGSVEITHRAKFLTSRPTAKPASASFGVIPLRGAAEGNRLRTADQVFNGEAISVSQHAHCTGWLLVRSVIDPIQGSVAAFDSVLSEWNVDAQSRATWRADVAALYQLPAPPVSSEIVAPLAAIDWSKMSRPVSDIDEQRAPVAARRAPFWKRWLGLGA